MGHVVIRSSRRYSTGGAVGRTLGCRLLGRNLVGSFWSRRHAIACHLAGSTLSFCLTARQDPVRFRHGLAHAYPVKLGRFRLCVCELDLHCYARSMLSGVNMATVQETAAQTLSMLEERLERINYVVNGGDGELSNVGTEASGSASARLKALDRNLNALAARSFTVSDVLQFQTQHPELFNPTDARSAPTTLAPAALGQLLLAHEELFKASASQLSSLNENKEIPDSAALSKLLSMEERMQRLRAKQTEHAREFTELRTRSAKILENWYENGVLDMGQRWAEWEERLKDCEILVRRREAAKKREEGAV